VAELIHYNVDSASVEALYLHLSSCSAEFDPPLASRVDIAEYAAKLRTKAVTFESWSGNELIGLVAAYLAPMDLRTGFISSVSTKPSFKRLGIATTLIGNCVSRARELGLAFLELEVGEGNERAIRLYESFGFTSSTESEDGLRRMTLPLAPTE